MFPAIAERRFDKNIFRCFDLKLGCQYTMIYRYDRHGQAEFLPFIYKAANCGVCWSQTFRKGYPNREKVNVDYLKITIAISSLRLSYHFLFRIDGENAKTSYTGAKSYVLHSKCELHIYYAFQNSTLDTKYNDVIKHSV